jgi:hypothetical protein
LLRQSNPPACGTSRMRLRLASGPPPRIDRPVAGVPEVDAPAALLGDAGRQGHLNARRFDTVERAKRRRDFAVGHARRLRVVPS